MTRGLYTISMSRVLNIGVVMGGPSSEREISLLTGKHVVEGLSEAGHNPTPVFVVESENWFLGRTRGIAYDPLDVCAQFDVMFNALHGAYGEDGRVQQIFERCRVPYTGSGVAASAFAMNKIMSREIFKNAGLRVPPAVMLRKDTYNPRLDLAEVHRMSAPPWIVKPASGGSSIGVSKVWTLSELANVIEYVLSMDTAVLIEEYITGRELTCGILEHFEGETYHALHPVEIVPPEGELFTYAAKYDGTTQELPAPFFGEMLRHVKQTAITAHTALGCRHYSRTDMIIKGTTIYVLETNTLPGLTAESLFPKAASWSKVLFPQLLHHITQLAIGYDLSTGEFFKEYAA